MLVTLAVLLVILWLAATASAHTFGGLLNILLVLAAIIACVHIIREGEPDGKPPSS